LNPFKKYNFIAVEGNIGAGKTSFCNRIADDFNCQIILESFEDNPFLPQFYQNPERYAFPVELFFMTERHKQLQAGLLEPELFKDGTIADYFFLKTLLFAKNNLSDEEHRLFSRVFKVLNASFPKPDLLVYLHRSVENLQVNIEKRGREYEKDITNDYLKKLQNTYFEFFRTEMSMPILIIDVEKADFLKDDVTYNKLLKLMSEDYKLGINYITTNW
jgi:deoxyadenosine/deoxycytidine kinase|tara:strand:+ start:948 stop:1598 length:651 start_codon:yes stop_codon:yes gene_type:complete